MAAVCWTSVTKKLITGITGLGLVLFVIMHLVGNLLLLVGSEAFNGYSHLLVTLMHGAFVWIADFGLLAFFTFHGVAGLSVAWSKYRARQSRYAVVNDAGGASHMTLASKTMAISGLVLLVFVVLHVIHLKFGAGEREGYVALLDGKPVRDLYRLVVEEFNKPVPAFGYAIAMVILGLHLRHGFWSAFQSLGLGSPRLTPVVNAIGIVVAIVLALGFVFIPLYVYFAIEPPAASAVAMIGGAL